MLELKSSLILSTKHDFVDNDRRIINYLRVSITDRCNLRCIYCMPEEGVDFIPHSEILTYEEILPVVDLCTRHGIRKVRLTGGEPLVRKDIISFIDMLYQIDGLEEIALTTNGVLLKEFARPLKESGICRVNVSLDTLRPERFRRITRRDYFYRVWEGIEEAESAGLEPIKINVVVMRGVNDDEILDFARLTYKKPYHVRFIEIMPFGERNIWTPETFVTIKEILDRIKHVGTLRRVVSSALDGPARRYTLDGAKGEIGFIGALSNNFCDKCNRLRLTADGNLRGCLFSDHETDLKTALRKGRSDSYLLGLIKDTIADKPKNHGLNLYNLRKCARPMNSIGG
jgi:cyclic pyranopterin phosphate synthase